jgi:hypothetical protein
VTDLDLRYPIGGFTPIDPPASDARRAALADLDALPAQLRSAVAGLDDAQLDTPYRPDGWTVRQVVHHLADSHLNAFVRLKLALTEDAPVVKPYDEKAWAALPDARMRIDVSLALLDALHARLIAACASLEPADFARTYFHPEHGRHLTLDWMVQQYAWHGRHHVAHITALRRRRGW